jgi:hypothetical protein
MQKKEAAMAELGVVVVALRWDKVLLAKRNEMLLVGDNTREDHKSK